MRSVRLLVACVVSLAVSVAVRGEATGIATCPSGCDGLFSGSLAECGSCKSLWTARAGAMFLTRSGLNGDFVVGGGASGAAVPLIRASDFDFGLEPGWELSLQQRLGRTHGLEFRYFDVGQWSDPIALPPIAGGVTGYGFVTNAGIFGLYGGQLPSGSVLYETDLWSLEANFRRQLGSIHLFAGVRAVDVDEQISLALATASNFNNQFYDTGNKLVGVQLGAEAPLLERGIWRIDGLGKAGIYNNEITVQNGRNSSHASDFFNQVKRDGVAFVGELGLVGSCQVTQRLSAQVTGQLLWVEGIAIAAEQININGALVDGINNVATGGVVYGGFSVGLEYKF